MSGRGGGGGGRSVQEASNSSAWHHIQISATTSASKEGTETAVDLPYSRECTEKSISALPNIGPMKNIGVAGEVMESPTGKIKRGREVLTVVGLSSDSFFVVVGNATQITLPSNACYDI